MTSIAPKARPAAQKSRTPAPPPPPTVGFVSLGCPKALVDSERIITRLRAEGYAIVARLRRRRRGRRQHLRLPRSRPSRRASRPSARPSPQNGRVIVTGCLGVEKRRASARRIPACSRSPARTSTRRCGRRARGGAAAARSLPRPRAAGGPAPDAAPLRLSEDFRRLQQPLLVLHHPEPARRPRQPPRRARDDRGGAAGEGRRQGAARHQPGHQRLRPRPQVCGEPLAGPRRCRRASSTSARRWASSAPGCACTTSIPIRTSTTSSR